MGFLDTLSLCLSLTHTHTHTHLPSLSFIATSRISGLHPLSLRSPCWLDNTNTSMCRKRHLKFRPCFSSVFYISSSSYLNGLRDRKHVTVQQLFMGCYLHELSGPHATFLCSSHVAFFLVSTFC